MRVYACLKMTEGTGSQPLPQLNSRRRHETEHAQSLLRALPRLNANTQAMRLALVVCMAADAVMAGSAQPGSVAVVAVECTSCTSCL